MTQPHPAAVAERPRLIGRQSELDVLARTLSDVSRGSRRAVLLAGEAGVGKTRLLEEFLHRARAAGARSALGRCVRLDTCTLPFAPFLEVLRQTRERDGVLAAELSAAMGADAEPRPADGAEPVERLDRTRVFGLMSRLLAELSRGGPFVVAVEDAHWADASSLDLLRFLLASLHDAPVLLLLSYRSDELPLGHPRVVELQELARAPGSCELRLGPLRPAEVAALAGELRPGSLAPAQLERVLGESDGNPFYVEELLAAGFPEVPLRDTRLNGLLLARVAALPPDAREVVALAAAAGQVVDHEVLEAAWPRDSARLGAGLRTCVERHLLVVGADGTSYAFRHALVRDAVLADLLPGERRGLHERLAGAVAAAAVGSRVTVVDVARHWHGAARWPEALRSGLQAARVCAGHHGYAEAHEQYERALRLWDRVEAALRPADVDRAGLLGEAAEVARLAGETARALELLREALPERAGADSDWEARVLGRLGRCLWEAGDTQQAAEVCGRAIDLLQGAPPSALRAELLAAQGRMLMLLGAFADSAATCDEAVAMAREVGAGPVALTALITRGVDAVMTGDTERGLATLRETCRLASEGGRLEDLARAHGNLAAALGRLCRFQSSVEAADEGLAELERLGLPLTVGGLLVTNACESLVALGRWDEAESRVRQALARGLPASYEPFLHRMLGEIETARGRYPEAEAALASAGRAAAQLREPQYVAPYQVAEATLAAERGQPERARRAVTAALEACAGSAQEDVAVLACMVGLRAAADEASRQRLLRHAEVDRTVAEADLLWERAQALAHDLRQSGADLSDCGAALAHCRAEWARLHGIDDADLWAAAAEAWRNPGKPYAVAGAQLRQAECLLGQRRATAARRVLREALDVARRLGAVPLCDRLLELAQRGRVDLSEPTAERPRPAVGPALTGRERQVLQHLVAGRTNREMAAALFISLKTVDNHVTHVIEKLQARNRVEAAATALRLGLVVPAQSEPQEPTPAGGRRQSPQTRRRTSP